MSLSIHLYGILWDEPISVIGSKDRNLQRAILAKFEPLYEDLFMTGANDPRPDFDEGLIRLMDGTMDTEVKTLAEGLAFCAVVAHLGMHVGTLEEAGGGGRIARMPLPSPEVLWRPIQGYSRIGVPCWGGLRRDEIRAIPEGSDDPDEDLWLRVLGDALGKVAAEGKDLVAITM